MNLSSVEVMEDIYFTTVDVVSSDILLWIRENVSVST
jgi:hypothetical protein